MTKPSTAASRSSTALRAAPETLLQGREQLQDDRGATVVAHQADPPCLTLELAQATADLDAELVEQTLPHGAVVHAVGDAHGVELRQLMALRGGVFQPHSRQARLEEMVVFDVPGPA